MHAKKEAGRSPPLVLKFFGCVAESVAAATKKAKRTNRAKQCCRWLRGSYELEGGVGFRVSPLTIAGLKVVIESMEPINGVMPKGWAR